MIKQECNLELEKELLTLIEEEFEAYLDECDLDEDRGIDSSDFASHATEMIEHNHGKLKFIDFDINSYALVHADSNTDALFERALDAGDLAYEEYKESQWTWGE